MTAIVRGFAGVALCALITAACHRDAAQPPPVPATTKASPASDADVRFMQGMISHHAQAIEMVALLKTRSSNKDMPLLGLRIEVSQNDEIKTMRAWLKGHGAEVPDDHGHMMHGAAMPGMDMSMPPMRMPGMLTPDQMNQLAAATGAEFDRLFLELMIQHHEGALTMVKELMASPGAAQDSSVFAFASDVVADQTAEITRMRGMRARMGKTGESQKLEVRSQKYGGSLK